MSLKILKLLGAGKLYDKFLLPEAPEEDSELFNLYETVPQISNKDLFHEILPYYSNLVDYIEKIGYLSHAELLRYCFSETSEYFTRMITKDDEVAVEDEIGKELNIYTKEFLKAILDRNRITAYAFIAKIYQKLAEGWDKNIPDTAKLGEELIKVSSEISAENTSSLRRILSEYSNQTFNDEAITLSINYLAKAINNYLYGFIPYNHVDFMRDNIRNIGNGIKKGNKILVYDSLGKIASIVYRILCGE